MSIKGKGKIKVKSSKGINAREAAIGMALSGKVNYDNKEPFIGYPQYFADSLATGTPEEWYAKYLPTPENLAEHIGKQYPEYYSRIPSETIRKMHGIVPPEFLEQNIIKRIAEADDKEGILENLMRYFSKSGKGYGSNPFSGASGDNLLRMIPPLR